MGSYTQAERAAFRSAGKPGLDVHGRGAGCNMVAGSFEVLDFGTLSDGGLASLTITFEQFCEASPGNWLRGWVRYTQ